MTESYHLLINIRYHQSDSFHFIVFTAWIINLYITGVFAFSGFALPTQRFLPPSYYNIYNSKLLSSVYRTLNVDLFKKILLATLWKGKKQRKKYFNGKVDGIRNLELQSMKSEFGHLLPFMIIFLISIYLIINHLTLLGISTLVINMIGNLYPIILQRHHRMRTPLILKRKLTWTAFLPCWNLFSMIQPAGV